MIFRTSSSSQMYSDRLANRPIRPTASSALLVLFCASSRNFCFFCSKSLLLGRRSGVKWSNFLALAMLYMQKCIIIRRIDANFEQLFLIIRSFFDTYALRTVYVGLFSKRLLLWSVKPQNHEDYRRLFISGFRRKLRILTDAALLLLDSR